jgi:hypothetical protein
MKEISFATGAILVLTLGAAAYTAIGDERQRICQPGFAASHRLHGEAYRRLRDAAFARAGVPISRQCHKEDDRTDCYILDHIIPLELAGENILDNLQVQSRILAAAKDMLENAVHHAYCEPGSSMTLEQAQSYFHRSEQ